MRLAFVKLIVLHICGGKRKEDSYWWEANHKSHMNIAIGIADMEEKVVNMQSFKAEAKLQI